MRSQSDSESIPYSQIVPQLLTFTCPSLEPSHPNKPERAVTLVELLIYLDDFQDLTIGVNRGRSWDDNVCERGLVCANCARCMISFAIYNNIFKEYCTSLERQTVRVKRTI